MLELLTLVSIIVLLGALVALIFKKYRAIGGYAAAASFLVVFICVGIGIERADKAAQTLGFVSAKDQRDAKALGFTDAQQWEMRNLAENAAAITRAETSRQQAVKDREAQAAAADKAREETATRDRQKAETSAREEVEKEAAIKNALKSLIAVRASVIRQSARRYDYSMLARDPNRFIGQAVMMHGKVIQVLEEGTSVTMRVNVSQGDYGAWQDTVLVNYTRLWAAAPRVLEGDIVRLYGEFKGIMSYKAVMGQTIALPHVEAAVIENQAGVDVVNERVPTAEELVQLTVHTSQSTNDGFFQFTGTVWNRNDFAVRDLTVLCGDKSFAAADVTTVVRLAVGAKASATIDQAKLGPVKPGFPPNFCKIAKFERVN